MACRARTTRLASVIAVQTRPALAGEQGGQQHHGAVDDGRRACLQGLAEFRAVGQVQHLFVTHGLPLPSRLSAPEKIRFACCSDTDAASVCDFHSDAYGPCLVSKC